MSSSSSAADADAAAAAKMAAHLGLTDMNASEISEMLQLKQVLFPMFQVCIAFLVLAWFSVSLRVYARAVVLKSFGADDWLMLLTLAVFTTCCATLIAIEGIERSDAASEAVAQGLIAQLPMMQQIFRVSRLAQLPIAVLTIHSLFWHSWQCTSRLPSYSSSLLRSSSSV